MKIWYWFINEQDIIRIIGGRKVNYVDTAEVVSGSVSDDPDCRACDLKAEFNRQINASSYVIFVIGDKTASRTAGSGCERNKKTQYECTCTPYNSLTPVSKADILKILPDVSATTVEAVLGQMVRDGSVRKIGSGRGTKYIKN